MEREGHRRHAQRTRQPCFSLARGSKNTGTKSVLIDDLTVQDAS